MYHIPLQNTDKVETGQTGLVLNLQPLCTSIMVPNVTLEKSYHSPLTAWRLHHPNNTRPKYRTVNCIVRNQIAPLLFHAAHSNLWAQLWSLISCISHYNLQTQPPGTPPHAGERLAELLQWCVTAQQLQLWAPDGAWIRMQHLEPSPACPVSPRGSSAPASAPSPANSSQFLNSSQTPQIHPLKLLRHNWSYCTPSLSSSERFLKLGGINPGLGDYHRHPFSTRLIAQLCVLGWDDACWRRISLSQELSPTFYFPPRTEGLKTTWKSPLLGVLLKHERFWLHLLGNKYFYPSLHVFSLSEQI